MTLGEKIKTLRKEKHLSIKELSAICGLTTVSISNYENDKHVPNPISMSKIAESLGCEFEDLATLVE